MILVLATHHFSSLGGSETYLLTVVEQLERLGHEVTISAQELGEMADIARDRGVRAVHPRELGDRCDAFLAQDAVNALELAERYPDAARVFVVHGTDFDLVLPPNLEQFVGTVVVLNDRVARRIRALAVEHPLVRLRQPVDLDRFRPTGILRDVPRRALLLGNYLRGTRRDLVVEACGELGIECFQVGAHGMAQPDPETAIAEADIVFGYGRCILEAMACGRAAYVLDHLGGDGWVTGERYPGLEANGFYGSATEDVIDLSRLRRDLAAYRPEMGVVNADLARLHHDANVHAQELIEVLGMVSARRAPAPPQTREMARLIRLQWQADSRTAGLAIDAQIARETAERLRSELEEATRRLSEAERPAPAPPTLRRRLAGRLRSLERRAARGVRSASGPAEDRPVRARAGARVVVVSPHLDDAVLSCWHVLAGSEAPLVINVFTGLPERGAPPSLEDRMTGAEDAAGRARERIAEDRAALACVGVEPVNLDFPEHRYRFGDPRPGPLAEEIAAHVGESARIYAPAGIGGHPDHVLAREAARALSDRHEVWLYADFPYAAAYGWPSWVTGADPHPRVRVDAYWNAHGAPAGLSLGEAAARAIRLDPEQHRRKLDAMGCYETQLPIVEASFAGRLTDPELSGHEVVWSLSGLDGRSAPAASTPPASRTVEA